MRNLPHNPVFKENKHGDTENTQKHRGRFVEPSLGGICNAARNFVQIVIAVISITRWKNSLSKADSKY